MTEKTLTVALLGKDFGWGGGVEFLRHVANGLFAKRDTHRLKIYLLLPIANKIESPTEFLRVLKRSLVGTIKNKRPWLALPRADFHDSMLDCFSHTHGGEVEIIYYENSNTGLLRCMKRINANVALPVNGSLGDSFPIPWVGYIYDFQHKYLPNYFDPIECFNREIGFATTLRDSKALIVNSKAVKDDICRFYPWIDANKIFNLPFAPHLHTDWFESERADVRTKYHLPSKYFLISNQFWVHKNHLTALRALKRVADSCDVGLVCTGSTDDYRYPGHMEEIKHFISENRLTERVKILGHIPKMNQIEIMKSSLAVLQPTLFEGGPGGGCVYDAVSLGVPVILSNIPVNKEVVGENIWFFDAGSDESLAAKMVELLGATITRPSQEKLLRIGQDNLFNLGNRLIEAIAGATASC
jgi:glycosyltransferase involved in cell wall biosynthesis